MASSGMGSKVVSVVGLMCIMVMGAFHVADAALSCQMVANDLFPCLGYVRSGGATVPDACCSGIRSLYAAATTTIDRQTACSCLKQAAGMVSGVNLDNAAILPAKCGVNIPYKISPSTDCAKVQ